VARQRVRYVFTDDIVIVHEPEGMKSPPHLNPLPERERKFKAPSPPRGEGISRNEKYVIWFSDTQ
jgi:hypothetical protein